MKNKKFYTMPIIAMILYMVLCSVSFASELKKGEAPQYSPQLLLPENLSQGILLNPEFIWTRVEGATEYRAELSITSGKGIVVIIDTLLPDNKFRLPDEYLSLNTSYNWRICAYNVFGYGPWSDYYTFTTTEHSLTKSSEKKNQGVKGGLPEFAPQLLLPEDLSQGIQLNQDFIWMKVDDAANYRIELNIMLNIGPAVLMDTVLVDNKFRIPEGFLSFNTTYSWRVCGCNQYGYGPWSEYFTFTTTEHGFTESFSKIIKGNLVKIGEPETAPVLVSPGDNSVNIPLTSDLTWETVNGATIYRIMIAKLPELITVYDAYTEDLKYRVPEGILEFNTGYTWTISGCNENGSGPWAVPFNFSTKSHSLESEELAKNYKLLNNYPNPFNPVTKIGFSISRNSFVKIKVYDMLGREVKVLVNGMMNAGSHNVDFNASNLASGIYIYKMEAGEFQAVKKMMLIK